MEKPQEIQLATATQTRDASKLDSVPNFKSRFSFVKAKKNIGSTQELGKSALTIQLIQKFSLLFFDGSLARQRSDTAGNSFKVEEKRSANPCLCGQVKVTI
ncbi:hypothetical protein L5515_002506 [Caenorhabditis briggsae]|uniref:Uncharacterized protein n=1 Tax=Caenorhabditis briggsae TaxID=6238 RepID=A0AAE9J550_CAEBR|nr:hypothetical protein L5515_002506 [Caenorhabditis briggsae]